MPSQYQAETSDQLPPRSSRIASQTVMVTPCKVARKQPIIAEVQTFGGLRRTTRRITIRHGVHHFRFDRDFATSRACSMNSFATGLSVRFFRVTMPVGI